MHPNPYPLNHNRGQTLFEIIISLTLISVTLVLLLGSISLIPRRQARSLNHSRANLLSQEGIEIFFYLAWNSWTSLPPGDYVPQINAATQQWEANSTTPPGETITVGNIQYQRLITIKETYRDPSGEIDLSSCSGPSPGCVFEPNIRLISGTVTWNEPGVSPQSIQNSSLILNPDALANAAGSFPTPGGGGSGTPAPPPDESAFASAWFAKNLTYYSDFESLTSVTNPQVGAGGSIGSNSSVITGKYGNGIDCHSYSDRYYTFPTSQNLNLSQGAIEFWYRPDYDYGSTSTFPLVYNTNGTNGFYFSYNGSVQALRFTIRQNGTAIDTTVTDSALWSAGDWVHLRITWNDSLPIADQLRIFVNGQEPNNQDDPAPSDDFNSSLLTLAPDTYIGDNGTHTAGCTGTIDEFRIYNSSSAPTPIASGGDTSNPNEYLARTDLNYNLNFSAIDSSNRGPYLWLGNPTAFSTVNYSLLTPGGGSGLNFQWQYWNGTQWSTLPPTGQTDFTNSGSMTFSKPADWLPYSVNGSPDLYYIRGRLAAGSYSPSPTESTILVNNNTTTNYALSFNTPGDGSSDYIVVDDPPDGSLDLGVSDFTIETWINISSTINPTAIINLPYKGAGGGDGNAGYWFYYRVDQSKLKLNLQDNSVPANRLIAVSDVLPNLNDDNWHHIAAVADRDGNAYFYLDGNLVGSPSISSYNGKSLDSNKGLLLSSGNFSYALKGEVDELRIWNTTRTQQQIQDNIDTQIDPSVNPNLIGYWRFDDNAGQSATDLTANANNFRLGNTTTSDAYDPVWTTGYPLTSPSSNYAVKFDGTSNQAVNVGDPTDGSLELATSNFTIEAWVYRTSSAADNVSTIVAKRCCGSPSSPGYTFNLSNSSFNYRVSFTANDGTNDFQINGQDNTILKNSGWHHVAVVVDRASDANSTIYVDGVNNKASITGSITSIGNLSNNEKFGIGIQQPGAGNYAPMAGTLDEVRIWDIVRTQAQIQADMNQEIDPASPNLIAYWRLNEGTGTTTQDLTSNNNNGTLVNGPIWTTGHSLTPLPTTTNNFQASDSSNDANEQILASGDILYHQDQPFIWYGNSQGDSYLGLRFANITIPKNSTINSARIKVKSDQLQNYKVNVTVYGDNTANSQPFANINPKRPSERSSTIATLNFEDDTQWLNNSWYYLVDVKPIAQELVNLGGWSSGNAMSFIFFGTGSDWSRKEFYSFDNSPFDAPIIEIDYTP